MSKGILDVRHLPLPPDIPWTVCDIRKLTYMTQHYHCTPPLTVGNILPELFQFRKKFQINALLNFHSSHESGRTRQHSQTQTKLRGKPTDTEWPVQSCLIQVDSRLITFTWSSLYKFPHTLYMTLNVQYFSISTTGMPQDTHKQAF
jgi:hypothetical protein